jgi:hypothetical protein
MARMSSKIEKYILHKTLAIYISWAHNSFMNSNTNSMEKIGAYAGIVGAFLVATNNGDYGYPFFAVSSILLMVTSCKQKNWSLLKMQSAFFLANAIGIYTFCMKG